MVQPAVVQSNLNANTGGNYRTLPGFLFFLLSEITGGNLIFFTLRGEGLFEFLVHTLTAVLEQTSENKTAQADMLSALHNAKKRLKDRNNTTSPVEGGYFPT